MANPYGVRQIIPSSVTVVVPNDGVDLATEAIALHIGTAGDVKLTTGSGDVVTLPLPVGRYDLIVKRVWALGTTATNIHALS